MGKDLFEKAIASIDRIVKIGEEQMKIINYLGYLDGSGFVYRLEGETVPNESGQAIKIFNEALSGKKGSAVREKALSVIEAAIKGRYDRVAPTSIMATFIINAKNGEYGPQSFNWLFNQALDGTHGEAAQISAIGLTPYLNDQKDIEGIIIRLLTDKNPSIVERAENICGKMLSANYGEPQRETAKMIVNTGLIVGWRFNTIKILIDALNRKYGETAGLHAVSIVEKNLQKLDRNSEYMLYKFAEAIKSGSDMTRLVQSLEWLTNKVPDKVKICAIETASAALAGWVVKDIGLKDADAREISDNTRTFLMNNRKKFPENLKRIIEAAKQAKANIKTGAQG